MRVMVFVKATEDSEKSVPPTPEAFEAMDRFTEELVKAGVLVAAAGLKPSAEAKRIAQRAYEASFFGQLMQYCLSKSWNPGWAKHKYRAKFGKWPRFKEPVRPTAPGVEVLAFIRDQNAKFWRENNKDRQTEVRR